jgi:DivIVA domain-containing protein
MDLTPQTLHAVEFREARRGGYNTRDVDDFLERVAAGVQSLHDRVRDAMMRAESAETRAADAHRQLDEAQRRPNDVTETDDTLRRTLVLAQRTADATIKEAKDEAARLLSEAREEASRARSEIEAEARLGTEGARLAAEAEVEQLLEARDALQGDIESLNDALRQQRDRIRGGISELERVLDDPSLLHPSDGGIALADVVGPNETGRHARVELPEPPPAPALTGSEHDGSGYEPGNGYEPGYGHEPAVPFLPGNQVASLQDAPLPARAPSELAPTPYSAFAFNGNGAPTNGEGPVPAAWPSQLRTSVEEEQQANGKDLGFDPGSRPSEWGRPVFDRKDGDPPPFNQ